MQCTPEQIEEKKRIALLRLHSKRKICDNLSSREDKLQNHPTICFTDSNSRSPIKQEFCFKPYLKPKSSLPFYGATTTKSPVLANCCLISESRFAIDICQYSAEAVNIFRSIPSKSYGNYQNGYDYEKQNTKTRRWDFHLRDYEKLQIELLNVQPKVLVTPIPTYALRSCLQSKSNYHEINLGNIDRELLCTLMPFQEDGVRFGIDKNGRCLIADDMGLGKTLQALGIATYYKTDWPLLIITTTSMKNIWEEVIHKYLPSISVLEIQYMITSKDYIGDAKVLITSHDMVARALEKLKGRNFGVIIIDESHTFKNFKAKCTQACAVLAKKARRLILLSGTPALSRPSELYTQLSLIDDKFFGTFLNYSKRYCDGKNTQYGWDASGQSNLQELEVVLNKKFMIRRTKQDVLRMLPKKKQEIVTLDVKSNSLTEGERKELNSLSTLYSNTKRGSNKHAALLTFFAETSKFKIPSVCAYLAQILDSGTDKFLIFAHHKIMLDAIQKVITRAKNMMKFIRIDGSTTSEQRKFFVDKFQFDDTYICAILSITAANAGITLTKAKFIIFAELHWNPSILSQAESRAHRIGQEDEVIVRYLIAPGTADDPMWNLLLEKQKTLNEIGLFNESFDNVSVSKQDKSTESKQEAVGFGTDRTDFDTLDISSYFEEYPLETKKEISSSKVQKEDKEEEVSPVSHLDCFDEEMDRILSTFDI